MTRTSLVWFGLLAAPTAWVAQLVAGYTVEEAACSEMPVLGSDPDAWLAVVSVAALVVAVLGGAAALVSWLAATAANREEAVDPRGGRIAFMAGIGVLGSLVFLAVIALGAAALLSLDACQT